MKVKKLILLCAAGLVVAGCGSSGGGGGYKPVTTKTTPITTIAAGEEKTLFPITVGSQWTYEAESNAIVDNKTSRKKRQLTIEVKSTEPKGAGTNVLLELREDDVVFATQTWYMDDTGVYQVNIKSDNTTTSYNPPQLILKFPVEVDQEWEYTGTGPTSLGANSKIKAKSVNKGPQLVDTFAGQVSAYQVETTMDLTNTIKQDGKDVPLAGKMTSQAFFAPKLGMVRLVQTIQGRLGAETTTHTLMQSTVK